MQNDGKTLDQQITAHGAQSLSAHLQAAHTLAASTITRTVSGFARLLASFLASLLARGLGTRNPLARGPTPVACSRLAVRACFRTLETAFP